MRAWSDGCGTVEDLAPWSSPARHSTPPFFAEPAALPWRNTSPQRSTPGPLPYQMPTTPSWRGPCGRIRCCGAPTAGGAGALAVPDADHAVVAGALRQIELLRAPDRGGREILIHAGLEFDVVLLEVFSGGEQLLVVAAERRAAIAADEARGVESAGTVAADLRHRQPDQRLNTGQEDVAGALGVFLVETDRTLVDSHSTLFRAPAAGHRGGLFIS